MEQLIGVADIASALGVSKQRADALTRTRGFPDPARNVVVVDGLNARAVREFFRNNQPRITTAEETLALFQERAIRLPAQPRLWRFSAVKEWAASTGREWLDEPAEPLAAS